MFKNRRSLQLHITPMLVGMAFFMQTLDGSILNTALPSIADAFGENPLQAQSLIFVYVITVGIFLPLSGWAFDRFGSLATLIFAAILFTAGSFLCASAQSFNQLIMFRIIQGIGGGLMVPAGRLEVLKLYPKRVLIPILNFVMIPGLLGTAIGPAIGGFVVEYAEWYWVFLINIPIGLMYIGLCYFLLPDIKEKSPNPFDGIGFVIFVIFTLLISIAVNDSKVIEFSGEERLLLLIGSVFSLIVYYFYARNKKAPLFNVKMFKISAYTIGILGNIFSRLGGGAIPFLLPLMLQVGIGYSPSFSGFVMLAMGVMIVLGKVFAPYMIKHMGYKSYLIVTTILLFISSLSFYFLGKETPEYIIFVFASVFGIAITLQFSGLTALSLIALPKEYLSGGNGLLSVVMQIAFSIGIAISGFCLAYFGVKFESDILPAFHHTYIVIAVIMLVPVFFYVLLPGKGKIAK